MPPAGPVLKTTATRSDITRRVHEDSGRVYFNDTFRTYVARRISEIAEANLVGLPEIERDEDTETDEEREARRTRRWERGRIEELAFAEVSRALNIRRAQVDQINGRIEDVNAIDADDYKRFAEWEAASRRLEPLRACVAIMRDVPDASRTAIESVAERLSERDREEMRVALDEFLLASDLADELRRLLASASAKATAVLKRRHVDEPLVAYSPVPDYEPQAAARPLMLQDKQQEAA